MGAGIVSEVMLEEDWVFCMGGAASFPNESKMAKLMSIQWLKKWIITPI